MDPWLKFQLIRLIIRKVKEKRMFKKVLREGGIVAMIAGVLQLVTGVDVAPDDVDKIVAAVGVIAIYGPQVVDGLKARFGKKAE